MKSKKESSNKTAFTLNRLIRIVAALALLQGVGFANVPTEGNGDYGGNGGGGVVDSGIPRTFYDAGLNPVLLSNGLADVPGVEYTLRAIDSLTSLSADFRGNLKRLIVPSPLHTYYEIDEDTLSDAVLQNLKNEYQRVVQIQKDRIAIVAVTQPLARKTFLLPHFRKLRKPRSQAAILFHEAFWISHPAATYEQVIAAEVAFESLLEQPKSAARTIEFLRKVSDAGELFRYTLALDFASGALDELASNRVVSVYLLFGPQFLSCAQYQGENCAIHLHDYLSQLSERYPKSHFLKEFRDQVIPRDPQLAVSLWLGHTGFGRRCYDTTSVLDVIMRVKSERCVDEPFDERRNDVNYRAFVRPITDFVEALRTVRGHSNAKKMALCPDEAAFASCALVRLEVRKESVMSAYGMIAADVFPMEYMGLERGIARRFQLILQGGDTLVSDEDWSSPVEGAF